MKWTSWHWAKSRGIIDCCWEILHFVVGSKPWLLLSGMSPRGRWSLVVWFGYENDRNACVLSGIPISTAPRRENVLRSLWCMLCGSLFLFFRYVYLCYVMLCGSLSKLIHYIIMIYDWVCLNEQGVFDSIWKVE